MNDTLITILAFGFALGVIVIVHEAGHLMVAKAFGVRVMTFSIGFGRRLVGFTRGETEYRISLVPLGGYVRLGGENPEESTGDPREFLSKPRWQRVLVYLAGPTMNVVLAVALFAGLFMVGIELPNLPGMPPLVGGVEPGSSAAAAGLQRGDLVVRANGENVSSWQDVEFVLMTSPNRPVALEARRDGHRFTARVVPQMVPKYGMGDYAGLIPSFRPQIMQVEKGSPAAAAGFRPGDEIRSVEGRPIADRRDFIAAIEKRPGQRMTIQVARNGRILSLAVVPRTEGKVGKIGVGVGFFQRYPPGKALVESVRYSLQIVSDTFRILGKIFRREMSAKGALAGPIGMAQASGEAARIGFKFLLQLMGFFSISIALLNLMPIPILDGGQIFILLIEEVIRRDLSVRVKEVISQVGFVLILMLMAVVIYFDLAKHLPGPPGS
ncbi:MAG TPA: RIP metalloprotease RseP [Thermoanaerobaculia bacterium]|nr:RIP metalloprotease RseP [Thermoanaerobaculia bacterium]